MKPLARRLPFIVFAIAFPCFFIGSYFTGIEYRKNPSGKTEGVVLNEDLADHAKITARYSVSGISYEHIESGGLIQKDGKIDIYYFLSDPKHATYENPEWIWYEQATGKLIGVGLWCVLIYFILRLQEKFSHRDDKK